MMQVQSRTKFGLAFWRSILLGCVVLLSACAHTPIVTLDESLSRFVVQPEKGMLLLKVHMPETNPAPAVSRWVLIHVQNVNTNQSYDITNIQNGYVWSHSVFVDQLPAGTYTINYFRSNYSTSAGDNTLTFPTERLGRFSIEKNRLTDLGSVITMASGRRTQETVEWNWRGMSTSSSQPMYMFLEAEDFESRRIRALLPLPYRNQNNALGWLQNSFFRPPVKLPPEFRQEASTRFSPMSKGPNNEVLIGEDLGQLRVRTADGRWNWINTGTLSRVRTISALADGTIAVGSSQGIIMIGKLDGASWQQVSLPTVDCLVVQIAQHQQQREVYVLAQAGDDLVLWSTSDIQSGEWRDQAHEDYRLEDQPLFCINTHKRH